jgi:hypothetical protein
MVLAPDTQTHYACRDGVQEKGRLKTAAPFLLLVKELSVSAAAAGGLRRGKIDARQFLRARRRVVNEDRFDDGHLFQIGLLDAIVDIHVGVVGTGVIVHRVLNELEARQTNAVEGQVIGAAGIANGNHAGGKIFQRRKPSTGRRARSVFRRPCHDAGEKGGKRIPARSSE